MIPPVSQEERYRSQSDFTRILSYACPYIDAQLFSAWWRAGFLFVAAEKLSAKGPWPSLAGTQLISAPQLVRDTRDGCQNCA